MKQVIVGFGTEGSTDERFLRSVIQRSVEEIAFECNGQIEIFPVHYIAHPQGDFVQIVTSYALEAEKAGVMVLCIHVDADAPTDKQSRKNKIVPAFAAVQNIRDCLVCKNLVAIIPVQMMEAWMLSDKKLLQSELGTEKSFEGLGLNKDPEAYSDPKKTIEDAIRIARQGMTKRRRQDLTIGELYQPIGQKISLVELEKLPSYQSFKEEIRGAFRKLNYLN